MRNRLVNKLVNILPSPTAHQQVIEAVASCTSLLAASLWRYNSLAGVVTSEFRFNHKVRNDEKHEHIHPITDGLLGRIFQEVKYQSKTVVRIENVQAPSIQSFHLSADRARALELKRLVSIPFFNHQQDTQAPNHPAGFLNLYPHDSDDIDSDEAATIGWCMSTLETVQQLRSKDHLATEALEILSGSLQSAGVLNDIIRKICVAPHFFNVEACSIYEWSTQKNVFSVAATTGIPGNLAVPVDFTGAGLVGEVIRREKAIIIQDLNNSGEILTILGSVKSADELYLNMETLTTPAKNVMLVPIYNPAAVSPGTPPIGVIRFVNKRCRNANFLDAFSSEDLAMATELARILAFHADHRRLERSRHIFALQFGHEANAPAVGIKGSAEVLLKNFEDENYPKAKKLSLIQDVQNFSELIIAFSESIMFGFGDRTRPMKSRYRIRKGDVRASIEQAKKVVIPICRAQGLKFDKIAVIGTYPEVYFDSRAFTQVFYNLLTNAIKYRSRDSLSEFSVLISCHRSLVPKAIPTSSRVAEQRHSETRKTVQCYRIDVMDYGLGIPDDYRNKIFDEGYRIPNVSAFEIRGSGMGLSIAKNILADFKCSLSLTKLSEPTIFSIYIPLSLASSEYARELMNSTGG